MRTSKILIVLSISNLFFHVACEQKPSVEKIVAADTSHSNDSPNNNKVESLPISPSQPIQEAAPVPTPTLPSVHQRDCFEEDVDKLARMELYPMYGCADGGCDNTLYADKEFSVLCRNSKDYPFCNDPYPIIDAVMECPKNYGLLDWNMTCFQAGLSNASSLTPQKTNTWWMNGTDMAAATYEVCARDPNQKLIFWGTLFHIKGHRKCCTK